jgi:hypothetical protein
MIASSINSIKTAKKILTESLESLEETEANEEKLIRWEIAVD